MHGAEGEGAVGGHDAPAGRLHYRFGEEIARGGMGRILAGLDTDLWREVAIKVLDPALADRPVALRRFVEEAQIAGQLQHPGVVPVYAMGRTEDQRPWFAMKLVKGRTFAELLAERREPAEELARHLRVFESVCQTLAYAHAKGVIHRDLKPANVMVGSFGEVLVLDWGLAKVLARDEEPSEEPSEGPTTIETVRSGPSSSPADSVVGSVMGTPAYMPPEQATGRLAGLDARADVFSLGAILCQILTGRPPYAGTEEERTILLAAQAALEPALERLESSGAPEPLLRLCRQCLASAPAGRPRDAGELAERMRAYFAGLAQEARDAQLAAAEARVRAAGERRARRLTLGLSATVIAALLAVGGAWGWTRAQAERRRESLARAFEETGAQVLALQRERRFADALEVARNGRRIVDEAGEATGGLRERAARLEALAAERAREDDERRELERRNALLLATLEDLRFELIDTVLRLDEEGLDRRFTRAFRDWGVDLSGSGEEVLRALEALRSAGIARAVVPALDDWAAVRGEMHGEDAVEAQTLTAAAMDLDPGGAGAAIRRALLEGDEPALLAFARDVVEQGAEPAVIWTLGFGLYLRGHRQEVLELLDRGARRYPGDYTLALAAGVAHGEAGRPLYGLALLQAACALRPEAGDPRVALAGVALDLGLLPLAVSAGRAAARLLPDEPQGYELAAAALRGLGRHAETEELLAAGRSRVAETRRMRAEACAARFLSGAIGTAALLEELERTEGAVPRSILGLALVCHPDRGARAPERARALAEELLEDPLFPGGWGVGVRASLELADPAAALAGLEGEAASIPFRSDLRLAQDELLRARALGLSGRTDEAREALRRGELLTERCLAGTEPDWRRSELVRDLEEARSALGD